MVSHRVPPSGDGERIVICNYNALLQSITGLLRMSGYCVFEAYDGLAAEELCRRLPKIELLILNTFGTGIAVGELIRRVRSQTPEMPVLHVGNSIPPDMPEDVANLDEDFTSAILLDAVDGLLAVA